MKSKSLQFILILAATIILTVIVTDFFFQSPASLSPDILSLTQPVHILQGKVAKVENKTIWVETTFNQPSTLLGSGEGGQSTPDKKTTYIVVVSDKTIINQAPVYTPYLFKTTSVEGGNGSLDGLSSGQQITVNSVQDLRTVTNRRITASSVQLSASIAIINGTITTISEKQITVKGNLSVPLSTNGQTKNDSYEIAITPETEISTNKLVSGVFKPQKLDSKNLKEGQEVTIFVNQSETQPFPALLVQPISKTAGDIRTPQPPPPPTSPLY